MQVHSIEQEEYEKEKDRKRNGDTGMLSKYQISDTIGVGDRGAVGSSGAIDAIDPKLHKKKRHLSSGDLKASVEGHTLTLTDAARKAVDAKKERHARDEYGAEIVDTEDAYDSDLDLEPKQEDLTFVTRGPSHRLVKMSAIEKDILDEVHHNADHLQEVLTSTERTKTKVLTAHELELQEYELQQARMRGESLTNSRIRPINPLGDRNAPMRRGQSAIVPSRGDNTPKHKHNMEGFGFARPLTAPPPPRQPSEKELRQAAKEEEKKKVVAECKARLGYSADNAYGLPADVFEDFLEPVSLSTGIKFLRTQSQNLTADYSDVYARRRDVSAGGGGGGDRGGARERARPSTASALPVATAMSSSAGFEKGAFSLNKGGLGVGGGGEPRPSSSSNAGHGQARKIPGVRVDMPRFVKSAKR